MSWAEEPGGTEKDMTEWLSTRACVRIASIYVYVPSSGWPDFPAPLVKEIVFNPLYILASFVKDKVSICLTTYLFSWIADQLKKSIDDEITSFRKAIVKYVSVHL